jgi:phosphatidylglycerol:prolipoprotein diacylglycerol transferase
MAPLNIPLHPIEVYEIVAYFLVFLLVWLTRKRYQPEGLSFFTGAAGYGVARFSVEFFRGHPAIFAWGIPAAQVFSVALILTSVIALCLLSKSGAGKKTGVKTRR